MIKAILLVLFIGLLLVGCEKDPKGSTPQSNHPTVKTPYLEDPATLDPIIAVAIDFDSLQMDGGLFFNPQKEVKYTGWAKWEWSNGQVKYLVRLKDGKQDGPNIWWYKNGHKRSEDNWKANRQDGLSITYNEDGTQRERTTWGDGKLMTAVAWKPDGEECPATNVLKGNGIVVRYNKDGSQKSRFTYRDGELVSQTPMEEKSLSERIENIEVDDLLEVLGKNSNTYDIDALLGEAEKLSSSQDEDAVALQDQRPSVALDSQRQVSPSPAQSASLPPGSTSSTEIRTLAKNYYFGRESALDYERAFALFAQLANSGDAEATRYLGIAYLRGKGVSKDRVKALQWFRVASQRGDALAAKNVRMLEGLGLDDSAITDPIESPKVIDLDDKETRDKIIAEAIDLTLLGNGLRKRSKDGEELWYAPNKTTPYSGWQKQIYVNGRVGSLTEYKSGRLDGQNVFWNEEGLKVKKYNWKEGKMHGLYTNWYKNGHKKEEGNYMDGKRDGLWTTWFEGGNKEKEKTFRDGILTDTFAWLPNGERCPFTNLKNGDGVVVHYYPNGQKWFKLNYKNYETFEPDGISISWYANGQKVGEVNRENGELDGLGTSWYESGQKRSEANYKDGKVLSVQVWKPDGEECPLTNLKDGNGFLIWYEDDGTEGFRISYKNGEPVD